MQNLANEGAYSVILSDLHALPQKESQTGVVPASRTGTEIEEAGKTTRRANVEIA